MQAASAIFFLNSKGDSVIHRVYRGEVDRSYAETFRKHVLTNDEATPRPVHQVGDTTFMHTRHRNLYIVLVTKANANAASTFKFLHDMIALFTSYFNRLDESSVRNNFVLIYELLDEIMDNGLPQVLDVNLLKTYITQESVRSKIKEDSQKAKETSMQVTGSVGWRPQSVKYKKNEVYLDVVESMNILMSSQGNVLRSEAFGKIKMKCYLSGMPELKLGLNDKLALENEARTTGGTGPSASGSHGIELEDLRFHQCVNLSRFASDKSVTFIPPDGEFTLLQYRVTEGLTLPFRILPIVKELGRTRLQMNVKLKSNFSSHLAAPRVIVRVPVPKETAGATIEVTRGTAKYKAKENALVWKVHNFPGQTELTLNAEVELVSTMHERKQWHRPPIRVQFGIPMFSASGMKVRFLKITEKSGFEATKWIRYFTNAGGGENSAYEIRTS